jgi:hypothetical protein
VARNFLECLGFRRRHPLPDAARHELLKLAEEQERIARRLKALGVEVDIARMAKPQ